MSTDLDIVRHAHEKIWNTTLYRSDPPRQDIWGNITWENGKAVGDCEEWADRAMDVLLSLGVHVDDIGVTLCHTRGFSGYDHAVCIVMAAEKGLMTCGDSYYKREPRMLRRTGYSFSRTMELKNPGEWELCPAGWPDV